MRDRVRKLPPFFRFGLIGAIGFLVDGGVLQALLSWADWGPLAARGVSFPVAVWSTWFLNRHITFSDDVTAPAPALESFARYVVVSLGGAGVNFISYAALMLASPHFAASPLLALAVASVIALAFNYLGSKHFAFRRQA